MLRRSILELSSRRSIGRISPRLTTQIPLYLSSRKEFSVASQPNPSKGSGSTAKPPDSGNNLSKVLVGSIALGAASIAAFQTGYLDKYLTKEQSNDLDNTNPIPVVHEESQQPKAVENNLQDVAVLEKVDDQNVQDSEILSPNVDPYYTRREEKTDPETRDAISDNNISNYDTLSIGSKEIIQENISEKTQDVEPAMEHNEVAPVIEENVMNFEQNQQLDNTNMAEGNLNDNKEAGPLLDAYLIRDEPGENAAESSYLEKEIAETVKDSDDISTSKDEKLVLDFLQAIHTAEKRQADLDAHVFSEEKRLLKEKYEKELKDARARELMYAERETILDKELHKEKLKAAAALKSLQEMLEEEFKMEIERKESERELELNKCKDLAKAELAAAIASEKASQIAKLEEANLNINALCMAFYARSEEARQSHSVHKLALGALALEDALSKGLPIQKEVDALNSFIHGIDKDSLLGLVMESLPQDTLKNGTDTILQLNHKFDGLKGTLRHFSLMPPGGGGILAHSLAYIASLLKVKEAGKSSDGIESLINRVDKLLADGKLIEAAETLENGLKGTQAAQIVGDWAQQARNRAITEQALTLLQSYATSLTHT